MATRTETQTLERCLRILGRLMVVREVRVSELFQLFEGKVSHRTLERDLQRLSAANLPLIDRQGTGRERIWSLDPQYKGYVPSLLGAEEVGAALLLGELSKAVRNTPFESGVDRLLHRLRQAFPVDAIRNFVDLTPSNTFYLNQSGIIDYRPHAEKISAIVQAIAQRKRCRITYRKHLAPEPSEMIIDPYWVMLFSEALYTVAFSAKHRKVLTLPFQRMISVTVLPEYFERIRPIDIDKIFADRIGIVGLENAVPEQVAIRFYPPVSQAVGERIWSSNQSFEQLPDNQVILRMQVYLTKELLAWILKWQRYAVVIEPESLRNMVVKALHDTLSHYST